MEIRIFIIHSLLLLLGGYQMITTKEVTFCNITGIDGPIDNKTITFNVTLVDDGEEYDKIRIDFTHILDEYTNIPKICTTSSSISHFSTTYTITKCSRHNGEINLYFSNITDAHITITLTGMIFPEGGQLFHTGSIYIRITGYDKLYCQEFLSPPSTPGIIYIYIYYVYYNNYNI